EWISSHTLHIYLLHAPDFLGYPDAIALARDHREAVERGLALKKAGNAIIDQLGGRAIHPVNVRVGGFYRTPHPREFGPLAEQLRRALDDALKTVEWASGFDFPDAVVEHELFALTAADRYAIEDGEPTVTGDRRIPLLDFESRVVEHQVPHSTALHAALDGRRFLTGPLARYSLNSRQLSPLAAQAAAAAGLGPECRNPFQSILVRAVEVVYAVEEALRILEEYELPERPAVPLAEIGTARVGRGVSEAPRGLLYHRYEISPEGLITTAAIVPPTSQNQSAIEDDLRSAAQANLHLDDASLAALCERIIRNYDPCISCSAHFLDLTVERR
ncbi:MAG: nickel-dependent hydrogenase large subunit, partial [Nocardiaceae bacterium]|nr:nickel-dependent hydrogenase large subunit [Nocardiaceae bacterium]